MQQIHYGSVRQAFISTVCGIVRDPRLIEVPLIGDSVRTPDYSPHGRTITNDSSLSPRLTQLGNGWATTHNGTSNLASVSDQDNFSFGTGTADLAMSVFVLANVTNTAANRDFVVKENEFYFRVSTTDLLRFIVKDQSANVFPTRISDAAITMGSWHTFAVTYNGAGGATAMAGCILYQDGVLIASTATEQATYVAMEPQTSILELGTDSTSTAGFFAGSLGLRVLAGGVMSAAQVRELTVACNRFYRLAL